MAGLFLTDLRRFKAILPALRPAAVGVENLDGHFLHSIDHSAGYPTARKGTSCVQIPYNPFL